MRILPALILAAVPALAQNPAPAPTQAPPINPATVHRSVLHNFRAVTVADGLENPWSIAFIPGGDILITERAGRLRLVRNGMLRPEAIAGVPAVRTGGQGGLLDVVLHPNFASNKLVYLSYAKAGTGADSARGTTAVARGRWENDRLNDTKEIFEANLWSPGRGHHGSRLAFDRNGFLFITLGDRQVPSEGDLAAHPAQQLTTHHGKIIRLHDDGRVPADNPFVGQTGPLPETFSYGHRSVQGLAIHPVSGDVYASEHGPQGGDEINILAAGKNYGWPVIGFGVNYRTGTAIHSGTMKAGMEQPVHVWVPSIGTSGLLWYTGDKFPEWKGSLFAGGMVGQQLVRLTPNATGRGFSDVETMFRNQGRVRDVKQSLDGFIYLAFDGQQGARTAVVRLEPVSR
jgi:glucose/arabinose dehydrogenase